MRWQSKGDIFWDILGVTSLCLLSQNLIFNNWIKIAIWSLAFILIVLLAIWYIYLCITTSLSEKVEKRMHYTVIILKFFAGIMALLAMLNILHFI
ncbi:MAG: hypothetical protein LBJ95_05245 [Oscillospiraceae bacterium]|nr:hypothetical protein [Oscillospiraceae bacterium]